MLCKAPLHYKNAGTKTREGGVSGNILPLTNNARRSRMHDIGFTFTSTAASPEYYTAADSITSTETKSAIPGGSGQHSALGRAHSAHHTTMAHNDSTIDARRPSPLRHGSVKRQANKDDTDQRGEASRDGSPGAKEPNCVPAFSSGGIKPCPAIAAGLTADPSPSTRRTTSNASKNENTHGCQKA